MRKIAIRVFMIAIIGSVNYALGQQFNVQDYQNSSKSEDTKEVSNSSTILLSDTLKLDSLLRQNDRMKTEMRSRFDSILILESQKNLQITGLSKQLYELDSQGRANSDIITAISSKIDSQLIRLDYQSADNKRQYIFISVGIFIIILIIALVFRYWHLRMGKILTSINDISSNIHKWAINKDNKSEEQHALTANRNVIEANSASAQDSYRALHIKTAEEIYRMRIRIAQMDQNAKGIDSLRNSIDRLENELNSMGYRMVDLTGLNYSDEMTAIIKGWESRNDIKPGKRIILRMISPQVFYENTVICPGQVVVGISIEDSINSEKKG